MSWLKKLLAMRGGECSPLDGKRVRLRLFGQWAPHLGFAFAFNGRFVRGGTLYLESLNRYETFASELDFGIEFGWLSVWLELEVGQ